MRRYKSERSIALVNVWSDHNRGDGAIVHATCDAIRQRFPDAKIALHNVVFGARDTSVEQEEHFASFADGDVLLYPALFPAMVVRHGQPVVSHFCRMLFCLRALLALGLAAVRPALARAVFKRDELAAFDSLTRADFVISKGGSYLIGRSWKAMLQLTMVMFPIVLARLCGRRTALLGVSVGPFPSAIAHAVTRFWFRYVDLFVLREEEAYNTCLKLGVPQERMIVLPDLAFLLSVFEKDRPGEPTFMAPYSRPWVAVTVRPWTFADLPAAVNGRSRYESYLDAVGSALKRFHEETGGTIVLVPQVIGPGPEASDVGALDRLEKLLGSKIPTVRPAIDMDFRSLRALYANMDMLVGTRLHSVILAFGIPTVIIGYQGNKSIGTARLLGLEAGFLHINDVTTEAMLEKMQLVWSSREQYRRHAASTKEKFRFQFNHGLSRVFEFLIGSRSHIAYDVDQRAAGELRGGGLGVPPTVARDSA